MNHAQRLPYLQAFIFQLAELTGRTEEDILTTGLYSTCFINNVLVKLEDNSTLNFNYAFYLESDDSVGIFTEHCGYYVFHKSGVEVVKQVPRSVSIKPVKEDKPTKEKNKTKKIKTKPDDVNLIPVDDESELDAIGIKAKLKKDKKRKSKKPVFGKMESYALKPIKPFKEKKNK